MSEGQHLEWKVSWRDDHLRSVCASANADGGTLEIGRDDEGAVVGVGAPERRRTGRCRDGMPDPRVALGVVE